MLFWNSLAFLMIQRTLAVWFLVPLPFLNPAWTYGISWFMYCWGLAWRILNITLLICAAAAKLLQSCPTLCDHREGSPPGSSVPGILQARTLEWVAISLSNACMHAKSIQLCPTLCNPMDSSPPGSSVHGILQARILEWVATSFSKIKTAAAAKSLQSCPTLCNPIEGSPPDSSVHGISQARVLEMSAIVLALPFFGIGMKTDLFQSCGHCWVFQICWLIEYSTFTASSFRIWNSSTGIPSPPLALFIVMLPKAYLTSICTSFQAICWKCLSVGKSCYEIYSRWWKDEIRTKTSKNRSILHHGPSQQLTVCFRGVGPLCLEAFAVTSQWIVFWVGPLCLSAFVVTSQ